MSKCLFLFYRTMASPNIFDIERASGASVREMVETANRLLHERQVNDQQLLEITERQKIKLQEYQQRLESAENEIASLKMANQELQQKLQHDKTVAQQLIHLHHKMVNGLKKITE